MNNHCTSCIHHLVSWVHIVGCIITSWGTWCPRDVRFELHNILVVYTKYHTFPTICIHDIWRIGIHDMEMCPKSHGYVSHDMRKIIARRVYLIICRGHRAHILECDVNSWIIWCPWGINLLPTTYVSYPTTCIQDIWYHIVGDTRIISWVHILGCIKLCPEDRMWPTISCICTHDILLKYTT